VGQYALVLWAAVTLNFALPHLAGGDPVTYLYGGSGDLTGAQHARLEAEYGLDRPVLEQYGAFWADLARGDLGFSVAENRPVASILADALPWTLLLVGTATVAATVMGTLLGALAAWRRGRRGEGAMVGGVLALDAMPGFWIGMVLIAVLSVRLGWFPSFGATPVTAGGWAQVGEVARRLALPAATITLASLGSAFLLARAAMTTTLDAPFIRLARAKGLSERRVALRHGLRNALLPVHTNVTLAVGAMFSGAVVVETVFAYPGMGRVIHGAVTARDFPLLRGAFLVTTVAVIAANLVAELTYPLVDPRARCHGSGR
jgi:peptide/nickel transport system permease protein